MKILGFLVILSIIFVIPVADAQLSLGQKAVQESVEVIINLDGEVHVKHVVYSSNYPKDLELIYGTVSNILVTNENGEEVEYSDADFFALDAPLVILGEPGAGKTALARCS